MTAPLFAGNQLQDFPTNSSASENTAAGYFDAAWVPNSLRISSATLMLSPTWAAQADIWFHWQARWNIGSNANTVFFQAYDNTATARVRLRSATAFNVAMEWFNGTTWVTLATSGAHPNNALVQNDIHIHINGAASEITWYVNKVVAGTSTGDYSTIVGITQGGWATPQVFGGIAVDYSEIIAHTVSTINRRYNLRLPSANGANTGFTGAYTDVNEAITNNNTFIYTPTAGNISTFPTAGKDLTGYAVDAVIVTNLSLVDVTGPQHEQWCLRIGGANYLSGVDVAVATGFTSYRSYLSTNPATGVTWLNTEAGDATMEVGLKATA